MIKVMIDRTARVDSEISPQWISDQVSKGRAAHGTVCVRVDIDLDNVHLSLSTPACHAGGAAGRPLNSEERQLLNNWAKLHLDTDRFAGNELVAFVRPFIH